MNFVGFNYFIDLLFSYSWQTYLGACLQILKRQEEQHLHFLFKEGGAGEQQELDKYDLVPWPEPQLTVLPYTLRFHEQ